MGSCRCLHWVADGSHELLACRCEGNLRQTRFRRLPKVRPMQPFRPHKNGERKILVLLVRRLG